MFSYELMCDCWKELPDKRPSFQEVVSSLNSQLEGVAGYMEFFASPCESPKPHYDHLTVYNRLEEVGCN